VRDGRASEFRLYQEPSIANLDEPRLRAFVEDDIIRTDALPRLVPVKSRAALEARPVDEEDVFLVLLGLIARYQAA
jgi:hypothetical protein